jgi:hypothetical protein
MFDSLFLLGVGGHTVYHGPATEAKVYFESLGYEMKHGESQADWFLGKLFLFAICHNK